MEGSNKFLFGIIAIAVVAVGAILLFTNSDSEDTDEVATTTESSQIAEPVQEPEVQTGSTIVELAQATPDLSTLVSAVVEAELVETLSSEGPFTVFAPTNDAFGELLASLNVSAEDLLARDDLAGILTYHVVSGEVFAADLSDGQTVTTVQGGTLTVSVSDVGVTLTDANGGVSTVVTADVDASNGVVHVIDAVLLP